MPTYVYEEILPDGESGERFEIVQSMKEEPLTVHPTTGRPVRRVPVVPYISGLFSEAAAKSNLSEKKLEQKGFTKYVKMGDGVYEKRTGKGPDLLHRD
ncbi:MAG: FmdB family transcriptional regulator [Pirellulales bacterium]